MDLRLTISPNCVVHAATFMSSGNLVLIGLTSTLLMYNEEGQLLHELELDDKAYDVTAITESMLVVTTGSSKRLVFVNVAEKGLEVSRKVELDTECFHLSHVDDKIVTANGSLATFFDINGKRRASIIMPGMIQYLYIAKMHKKMFLNIRSEYVMCTDLRGTKLFKYKSDDLKEVCGITVDNRCCAYVCGRTSGNVHHIDTTGNLIQVLLSREEGVAYPVLIGINCNSSSMFLVQRNDDFSDESVKLFNLA